MVPAVDSQWTPLKGGSSIRKKLADEATQRHLRPCLPLTETRSKFVKALDYSGGERV